MSKEQKITEEQLKLVADTQGKIQQALLNIGVSEAQKSLFLVDLEKFNKEMDVVKKDLEEEYGAVNINLKDGTFEEIKEKEEGQLKTV